MKLKYTHFPIALLLLAAVLRAEPPELKVPAAKSPQEEKATFQLHPGFRIELVACEPQITDPVALTFDQDGRLYVCEMRGYPNDGYGTGAITSGTIKLLQDRDGDGFYETATTFAEGLRFPMGVQPWRKGVFAAVAPDILYLEDTDGDGKADIRKVVYTGFGVDNIQQLLNSLQWGMDNWMYGCNGASGGTIRCPDRPDAAPVALGNRGIRFKPDVLGSLEPMSGGGQYGLCPDANQDWFTATNSEHLKQIILPDHYLRRNPGFAAPTPWANIPEHGAACPVFRVSPFEAWRVERTGRRAAGADASRFPKTELVPGGFVTSSCSPAVYQADRFPEAYRRSVFICEPANNLVLRDELVEDGPVFKSRRVDPRHEFLASTDNWFRPVHASIGPDGALYVVDFYRPVIETPRSLPDDMKAKLPLQTQSRGRIWRIVPEGNYTARKPAMSTTASADLVPLLDDPNIWWRLNAQRVLVERRDLAAVDGLRMLAGAAQHDFGRAHALWTLHEMAMLREKQIVAALKSDSILLRCQGLRLAEGRLVADPEIRGAAARLADDPAIRVRFQAAFSLCDTEVQQVVEAQARLVRRDWDNRWVMAALLSSTHKTAPLLLDVLLKDPPPAGGRPILARLAGQIGVNGSDADLARVLASLAGAGHAEERANVLRALGEGLQNSRRPLQLLWQQPPPQIKDVMPQLVRVFEDAARDGRDEKAPLRQRLAAVELLGFAPTHVARPALAALLAPQQPVDVQFAAVRALGAQTGPDVPDILLKAWPAAAPSVRREIQEVLFARPERLPALLDALAARSVLPQQLDAARVAQLRRLTDPKLRARAERLVAGAVNADRQRIVDGYKEALDLKSDAARGRANFRKVCATCHRLDDAGTEVGPDLRSALRDKSAEQLLVSILDPSREVDRRYTNYLVETTGGRSFSGMIVAETATSITLRRAEKAEDIILRTQIESIADTGKSLMPDGLEQQLTRQELADLIAYLRSIK